MNNLKVLAGVSAIFVGQLGNVLGEAASSFRMNFGSCHDVLEIDNFEEGNVWTRIAERNPNVFVWGGDNAYADSKVKDIGLPLGTPEFLTEVYTRTKNIPQYVALREQLGTENIIGTWDDHDFGLNNAGEEYQFKEQTQQLFLDFFEVSQDDPRRFREGVYHAQYFNEGTIKVITVDIRYFRDSYGTDNGDFLGEQQWAFLESELNENLDPRTKVTLIVSGIQMLPNGFFRTTFNLVESWNKFPDTRDRLLNTITNSKASNVALISGDVHYTEMLVAECGGNFYLPELTTSGMTHSWESSNFPSFLQTLYHVINRSKFQWKKQYYLDNNFGEIDFRFGESDEDSYLVFKALTDDGEIIYENQFFFSQMKPAGPQAGIECGPHND